MLLLIKMSLFSHYFIYNNRLLNTRKVFTVDQMVGSITPCIEERLNCIQKQKPLGGVFEVHPLATFTNDET